MYPLCPCRRNQPVPCAGITRSTRSLGFGGFLAASRRQCDEHFLAAAPGSIPHECAAIGCPILSAFCAERVGNRDQFVSCRIGICRSHLLRFAAVSEGESFGFRVEPIWKMLPCSWSAFIHFIPCHPSVRPGKDARFESSDQQRPNQLRSSSS